MVRCTRPDPPLTIALQQKKSNRIYNQNQNNIKTTSKQHQKQ
jgi:hypothetical protein